MSKTSLDGTRITATILKDGKQDADNLCSVLLVLAYMAQNLSEALFGATLLRNEHESEKCGNSSLIQNLHIAMWSATSRLGFGASGSVLDEDGIAWRPMRSS